MDSPWKSSHPLPFEPSEAGRPSLGPVNSGSVIAASFGSQVSASAPSLIPSVSLVHKYESFSSTAEVLEMSDYTFPLLFSNVILCSLCVRLSEWNIHSFLRNEENAF